MIRRNSCSPINETTERLEWFLFSRHSRSANVPAGEVDGEASSSPIRHKIVGELKEFPNLLDCVNLQNKSILWSLSIQIVLIAVCFRRLCTLNFVLSVRVRADRRCFLLRRLSRLTSAFCFIGCLYQASSSTKSLPRDQPFDCSHRAASLITPQLWPARAQSDERLTKQQSS